MIHIEDSTIEVKRTRIFTFKGTEKEFEDLVDLLLAHAETLARAWGTATKQSRLSASRGEDVLQPDSLHSFECACCW
jgi:hypothetical protein